MLTRLPRLTGLAVLAAALASAPLLRAEVPPGPVPKIDPSWLQVDSAKKEVTLSLTAALGGDNSGMNFNGFHEGGMTFTVPVGWTVVVNFTNKDGGQGHGFDVIPYALPVEAGPMKPALPNAATDSAGTGLPAGAKKVVRFPAATAGKYIIRCSVSGHGMMGMWIVLDVSKDAKDPSLTLTPKR